MITFQSIVLEVCDLQCMRLPLTEKLSGVSVLWSPL